MSRVFSVLLVALLVSAALPAVAESGAIPIPFTDPYTTPQIIPGPGHYVLTRNLVSAAPSTPLIFIDCTSFPQTPAPAVTIDLNGFILDNSASPTVSTVFIWGSDRCELIIRNGEIIGGESGIEVQDVFPVMRKVVIEDVEVKETTEHGIFLRGPKQFVIRRCAVIEPGGVGILLTFGDDKSGTIEDNLIRGALDGISVNSGRSVEISNNRIEGIKPGGLGAGIRLFDSSSCLLSQNTIEDVAVGGGPGIGVWLESTSGCKLYNNVINKTASEGILIDQSSEGNLVKDNVVRFAALDGLRVDGVGNRIEGNLFGFNSGFGLHFGPGSSNNQYGSNTGEANSGAACPPFGLWSPDFCDDAAVVFPNPPGPGPNHSFLNNLMPGAAGPI